MLDSNILNYKKVKSKKSEISQPTGYTEEEGGGYDLSEEEYDTELVSDDDTEISGFDYDDKSECSTQCETDNSDPESISDPIKFFKIKQKKTVILSDDLHPETDFIDD